MNAAADVWGDPNTHFFYDIKPETVLDAVEALGFRCTGRYLALNSLENRVYEVEIVLDHEPESPSDHFVVIKFYRPHRWTEDQILDEHDFLLDLAEAELPVIAPLEIDEGEFVDTLFQVEGTEIFYTVFPKRGGRVLDEITESLASRLGGLVARIHNVGVSATADARITLTPDTYGRNNLEYLLTHNHIPAQLRDSYESTVRSICDLSDSLFAEVAYQRIHGDCHMGNILLHPDEGLRIVDFDDMVTGPCVQDLWLLTPETGAVGERLQGAMLEGYEHFREFDRRSLRLIEPLRALRFVHFNAWIARRWQDPAFPDAFPGFGSERYWEEQLADLRNQLARIQEIR